MHDTKSKPVMPELPEGMAESLQKAEIGWAELLAASRKITEAGRELQRLGPPHSQSGFLIERAHWKHKPDHIANHLQGLQKFMQQHGVKLATEFCVF